MDFPKLDEILGDDSVPVGKLKCSRCMSQDCSPITGLCDKCKPGFLGDQCEVVCPYGTFGMQCRDRCPPTCDLGTDCHPVTGVCLDGCVEGFTGVHCNDTCQAGTFGKSCIGICSSNCVDGECSAATGECFMCPLGWKGVNCDVFSPRVSKGLSPILTVTYVVGIFALGISLWAFLGCVIFLKNVLIRHEVRRSGEMPPSWVTRHANYRGIFANLRGRKKREASQRRRHFENLIFRQGEDRESKTGPSYENLSQAENISVKQPLLSSVFPTFRRAFRNKRRFPVRGARSVIPRDSPECPRTPLEYSNIPDLSNETLSDIDSIFRSSQLEASPNSEKTAISVTNPSVKISFGSPRGKSPMASRSLERPNNNESLIYDMRTRSESFMTRPEYRSSTLNTGRSFLNSDIVLTAESRSRRPIYFSDSDTELSTLHNMDFIWLTEESHVIRPDVSGVDVQIDGTHGSFNTAARFATHVDAETAGKIHAEKFYDHLQEVKKSNSNAMTDLKTFKQQFIGLSLKMDNASRVRDASESKIASENEDRLDCYSPMDDKEVKGIIPYGMTQPLKTGSNWQYYSNKREHGNVSPFDSHVSSDKEETMPNFSGAESQGMPHFNNCDDRIQQTEASRKNMITPIQHSVMAASHLTHFQNASGQDSFSMTSTDSEEEISRSGRNSVEDSTITSYKESDFTSHGHTSPQTDSPTGSTSETTTTATTNNTTATTWVSTDNTTTVAEIATLNPSTDEADDTGSTTSSVGSSAYSESYTPTPLENAVTPLQHQSTITKNILTTETHFHEEIANLQPLKSKLSGIKPEGNEKENKGNLKTVDKATETPTSLAPVKFFKSIRWRVPEAFPIDEDSGNKKWCADGDGDEEKGGTGKTETNAEGEAHGTTRHFSGTFLMSRFALWEKRGQGDNVDSGGVAKAEGVVDASEVADKSGLV